MNFAAACIVAAVVVFALGAAGISLGVPMLFLGLALFAAGHLPWPV